MPANELLAAVAATGYFPNPARKQKLFRQVVENRHNIGLDRAIALLTESGLTVFSYISTSDVHLGDSLDNWQLRLTISGESALSGKF